MKRVYVYAIVAVVALGGGVVALEHHSANKAQAIVAPASEQKLTTPDGYVAPQAVQGEDAANSPTVTPTNTGGTPVTTTTPAVPTPTPQPNPVHPDVATGGDFTFDDPASTPTQQ